MSFGTLSDLEARVVSSMTGAHTKPLALLLGSGVAQPSVPNANKILAILRKSLSKEEQEDLDRQLAGLPTSSEKYQSAFQFLAYRRPPEFRERVVSLATLSAYTRRNDSGGSISFDKAGEYEADVDGWEMPEGLAAVGRIWAGLPTHLRGPILTTNFDPLVEISVRRAGGNATTHVHSDDGAFLTNLRLQVGTPVVHLHGYWRGSNTLHTFDQLQVDRPVLSASLRAILQSNTLLVIGYGGWSDVVTRQLGELVREQATTELDILWAMFENSSASEQAIATAEPLARLRDAPGNVMFYAGIDANLLFPAIERELGTVLSYSSSARRHTGVPVGWTEISPDFIAEHRGSSSKNSALSFFDGRLPQWHDAASELIPRRDIANQVANELLAQIDEGQPSISILSGPSGEGKSTAMMQAAVRVSEDRPDVGVLYLDSDYMGHPQDFLQLPPDKSYLLVIDDAHRVVERLKSLADELAQLGRRKIHLALATRDTDWQAVGGATYHWARILTTRIFQLTGVNRPDAVALVSAWERIGPDALGALTSLETAEERVSAIMSAARDRTDSYDGTFLGALLTTRYGAGLREHIRQLLERVRHWQIPGSEFTLLDALVAIALPHANGIRQLNFEVLAQALEIQEPTLHAFVLAPLGQEAAISYNSGRVLVRHSLIASSICDIAEDMTVDAESLVRRVASSAARSLDRSGGFNAEIAQLAFMSASLHVHPQYQVPAAEAASTAVPMRIALRTNLSAAYRRDHRPGEAIAACETAVDLLRSSSDPTFVRSFLTEWGVAEGSCGHWGRNALLVTLALQDSHAMVKLTRDKAEYAINCLPQALHRLYEQTPDLRLLEGAAASIAISESISPKSSRPWLRELETTLNRAAVSVPNVTDRRQLQSGLIQAARAVSGLVERPLPPDAPSSTYRFEELLSLANLHF